MKISFIIFAKVYNPIGGVKVVYEYANRLAAAGHDVSVIHAVVLDERERLLPRLAKILRFWGRKLLGMHTARSWFEVDQRVRQYWVTTPESSVVPDGDAVVATAWRTANWVAAYPESKGKKLYLIQHLETWCGEADEVINTWRLPLKKLVIAKWLQQEAERLGEASVYLPNGLDFTRFGLDVPINKRNPASIVLLAHWRPYKGTRDAVAALEHVYQTCPLVVTMFGVIDRPDWLPEWIVYEKSPEQSRLRAIYNSGAVFIAPSHEEGWGLPACEAMMCGCALIASDVGGHREFAEHLDTALLYPAKNVGMLAQCIEYLVNDQSLRMALAERGHNKIAEFTWEKSVAAFEHAIREA